ncbi:M20/M25/M40 family metallo-hydrolase [Micromonospora sp. R77]|uniref:M20/M25/M40 family metallo-hydrolase n=1 Tax=Micromonospora sp. R77 TaxID=2925836 RepID=UPI001F601E04|nr:M20/M25/M40 family metallo-hydrolase [Micromonospora sp. R77]MCI4066632.1 M20/M25/M40 family metallo-hydrolase [Micromonospora sp. R77]
MTDVTDMLRGAQVRATSMVDRLAELVTCESPPGAVDGLSACADLLDTWGSTAMGRPAQRVTVDGLPHLLWPAAQQQVLLLGHFDTVWPAGTIQQWPFSVRGTLATGPGVCDMKAGIVQMLTALTLLPDTSRVGLLLTCDEESGSPGSRALIEQQAARSGAVLVGEPSTEAGELKVARKGGSAYRLTVRGRAAHAGVEPHRGVNAGVEAAHQVLAVQRFAAGETTVTPTVLTAGTMSNVVPESAVLSIDVRAWTREELHRVDDLVRALRPHLAGSRLSVGGGINRYPLLEEVSAPLLRLAQDAAARLGLPPVRGAYASGASDANFTGALGVPTLDGLGGVGGLPHARGEWVDVSRMPERTALLAAMVGQLLTAGLPTPASAPST